MFRYGTGQAAAICVVCANDSIALSGCFEAMYSSPSRLRARKFFGSASATAFTRARAAAVRPRSMSSLVSAVNASVAEGCSFRAFSRSFCASSGRFCAMRDDTGDVRARRRASVRRA